MTKTGHQSFGVRIKDLMSFEDAVKPLEEQTTRSGTEIPDTKSKEGRKDFILQILDAWKEARQYDDLHLYDDHISFLKYHFDDNGFEFPDDYDFDTNVWTIGMMIAQFERYGGVVIDTDKGTLPLTEFPTNIPKGHKNRINEE